MHHPARLHVTVAALVLVNAAAAARSYAGDVVVYGSTPGGITSAVAAARFDSTLSVILLDYSSRVGGMCSGGLGHSDKGDTFAIGGLAKEFFVGVATRYNATADQPLYDFEPHVAEGVFAAMLAAAGVQRVAAGLVDTVSFTNQTITGFNTTDGATFSGAIFIDASYEGDLLARAGLSYSVGREGVQRYNESLAGRKDPFSHPFDFRPISPFASDGTLLPFITAAAVPPLGTATNTTQAYNFRLCVTNVAANRIPFPLPADYNATQWELLRRLTQALGPQEGLSQLLSLGGLPHGKFDMNSGSLVSTDFTGGSWAYPEASYVERRAIWQAHASYQQGLLWTLANDGGVPPRIRKEVGAYGLCADEFITNGGWPEQLYVREARRLEGDSVLVQGVVEAKTPFSYHSIGMGSYAFDGHYHSRVPCLPGPRNDSCVMLTEPAELAAAVASGADIWTGGEGYPGNTSDFSLYQIPYFVLLPKRAEARNLLSPVTPSVSHVVFASLRVEPQFMVLGHAAGVAAALAIRDRVAVQDVDERALHRELVAHGAVLCKEGAPQCP